MGGAPSVGVPCNAAMAPGHDAAPDSRVPDRGGRRATTPDRRYDSSASFAYGQAGGAARRSRHGRRGLRRRRRRGWRTPAAAPAQVQPGGTLNYAADQEPTGFNNNTSKDNGTSVANIVINMFPVAFHSHPGLHGQDEQGPARLGRADQRGPADDRLQDQAERHLVGRHPGHAPTTSSTCGRTATAPSRTTTSPPPPATTRSRASTGSDNGKTVTVVFKKPFADWKSHVRQREYILPAHYIEKQPGGWNTGLDKNPEKIPVGRLVQGRELHPGPEPDPGPQRQVLRAQGQPGLDGVPVPARVDHPAGGAAEQRGRPDLPAAPARPGRPRSRRCPT